MPRGSASGSAWAINPNPDVEESTCAHCGQLIIRQDIGMPDPTWAHRSSGNRWCAGAPLAEPAHEHDWTEDTRIGDPDRLYLCLTCGATRTETRPGT